MYYNITVEAVFLSDFRHSEDITRNKDVLSRLTGRVVIRDIKWRAFPQTSLNVGLHVA